MTTSEITRNLADVRARITDAAVAAQRDPASVKLIAASKTRSPDEVLEALRAGQSDFGENYVQEAVTKIRQVAELSPHHQPVWHFIGSIQTNKTRELARHFQWIHTVERAKVARRLHDQCPPGKRLDVCLQINVDNDPNKAGATPAAAAELLSACSQFDRLALRGLMTILDPRTAPEEGYNRLRELFEALAPEAPPCWDTLSMGMTGDFREAISAGATMVRLGTAVFGPRTQTEGD